MTSQAFLKIQNKDKHCFLWSILAHLHPCSNCHPERSSSYVEYFNEMNVVEFGFTNGFKTSDVKRFNTLIRYQLNFRIEVLFGRWKLET